MILRYVCGIISLIIILGFTVRVARDFRSFRKELENPVAFSVLPTYTMALMLLMTYFKPFIGTAAVVIWVLALTLQVVIMAAFVKTFVLKFNIRQVLPSWFVMFVGIVVASVTSPAMDMKHAGQAVFYLGFELYMVLLPVVLYRAIKIKAIPEPAYPTMAILCAPASLCLVGYISAFDHASAALVLLLTALCLIFWLTVLILLFYKLLRLPFSPGYSAFTFPLVISATAIKVSGAFFAGNTGSLLRFVSAPAILIAAVITFYTLARYCLFWFAPSRQGT